MKKFLVLLLSIISSSCFISCTTTPTSKSNNVVTESSTITAKDTIATYLEEECKKVFSPYYEILDSQISDYKEETVNGNIEATFLYTMIHKNYDKDPDTVGYIQSAKESGNPHYQKLYDEYLALKEANFYFKVMIDENDTITLYTNISPVDPPQWEKTEMQDFILHQS